MLVMLLIGFGVGLAMRPIFAPMTNETTVTAPFSSSLVTDGPRSTEYFLANIDEARQVVAGCRDGSVRGIECATAGEAIIKTDAAERRRRFLGN